MLSILFCKCYKLLLGFMKCPNDILWSWWCIKYCVIKCRVETGRWARMPHELRTCQCSTLYLCMSIKYLSIYHNFVKYYNFLVNVTRCCLYMYNVFVFIMHACDFIRYFMGSDELPSSQQNTPPVITPTSDMSPSNTTSHQSVYST